MIISFILVTLMCDSGVTLREMRFESLIGLKGQRALLHLEALEINKPSGGAFQSLCGKKDIFEVN